MADEAVDTVKEEFLAALEQVAARDGVPADTTETPAPEATPEATPAVESTATETPPASDDKNSAGEGHAADPAAGTGDTQAQVDPGLAQLASAYGFSPQDVAGFQSADEFLKAANLLDKAMSRIGQRFTAPQAPPADAPIPAQHKQEPQQPPPHQTPPPAPANDTKSSHQERLRAVITKLEQEGDFDPSLVASLKEIGEAVVSETERNSRIEQQLQAVIAVIQQQQQQQAALQQQQELERFKSGLDSLGRPDLFGTEGQLNDQNLTKLAKAMYDLRTGINAAGGDPSITNELVQRAMAMAFPGETKRQAAVEVAKKVQATSRQRMGTGQRPQLAADQVPYKGEISGHDAVKDPVFREWAERNGVRL